MPALFSQGSYDLAGYSVGILEYGSELSYSANENDLVIGLPSSGLHCSGFDYVYEVMSKLNLSYENRAPFGNGDQKDTYGWLYCCAYV